MKSIHFFRTNFLCFTAVIVAAFLIDRVSGADAVADSSLLVTVTHRDSREPLPGVKVLLSLRPKAESASAAETDSSGRCTVRWSEDSTTTVRVRTEKSGFAPLQMTWQGAAEDDPVPSQFAFALAPSQVIGGRVLDQADQPIAGARIFVNFPQRLTGPTVPLNDLIIQTDAEGRWKTDLVPAGAGNIRVTATHPDSMALEKSEPPSLASLQDQNSVIRLERLLAIAGRVLDPNGRPVSGAKVVRGHEWGIMGVEDNARTQTDSEGQFRFERLKAGRLTIAAEASGFGPALAAAEAKPDAAPVELTLQPAQMLRGRILDLSGAPIEGVRVAANEWERYRYPGWETQTGHDGTFLFTNMPSGVVSFDISKAGYMGRLMHRLAVDGTEHVIKLGPILRLHGRVLDATTGEPVAHFKVTPGWPRRVFRQGKLVLEGGEWAAHNSKQFTQGAYDLTFNRPMVAGGAEPDDFLLRVEADGYDPAVSRAVKPDEADAVLDFHLEKGTGLKGLVKLPDGAPASNAKIYAFTGFNWPYMRNGKILHSNRATEYSTGPDGAFTMPKPTEPMNLLVLHDSGQAELEAAALEKAAEIPLEAWARIGGELRIGKQIGARQTVALRYRPRYQREGEGMRQKLAVQRNYQTVTDDQGRFSFDQVLPGEVSILRVIELPRPTGMGITVGEVWGGCPLETLRLKPGERANVTVGGDGRVATGKLITPSELDVPTDWASGQFTIHLTGPKVEPPLGLNAADLQSWLTEWLWSDSGKLWRRWFGGVPDVMEDGMVPGGTAPWYVRVEKDGHFQTEDLPPGEYGMSGWLAGPAISTGRFQQLGRPVAMLRHSFTIPARSPDQDSAPVDLGTIQLERSPEMPQTARPMPGPIGAEANDPVAALDVAKPDVAHPLTASPMVHPAKAKQGETVTLFIKSKLALGVSIPAFSESENAQGAQGATTIDLQLPERLRADGSWQARQPFGSAGPVPAYFREVIFSRSVKIDPDAPVGPANLACDLHYQASNSMLVWPRATIRLETVLDVLGSE